MAKLNVDENPVTATRFNVRSIPALLILKAGQEIDCIVGVQPKRGWAAVASARFPLSLALSHEGRGNYRNVRRTMDNSADQILLRNCDENFAEHGQ